MRILSYAWYIYDSKLKEYANNCTGGGLVVRDLCEYLGKREESYLFIGQYTFPQIVRESFTIVKTDYDSSITKTRGRDEKYIKYMTSVFERTYDKLKPDVVHFHDCGDLAVSIIKNVCELRNIKYSLTLHLYIGKNPCFLGYSSSIALEERLMTLNSLNLVTVSNGEKLKILNDFPKFDANRITPLLNGTTFEPQYVDSDYKRKLNCGNRKVLLCAGTLNYRKNQLQLISVLKDNDFLRNNIFVIFCGNVSDSFLDEFASNGADELKNCMAYVGALPISEMKKLYTISDGLVMPSFSEGLSISALEAISYGLPVIMFRQSECAYDLADDRVVCFADDYTDESLSNAILKWYKKEWDKDYILEYSKYFTMERMTDDYIKYYKKLYSI